MTDITLYGHITLDQIITKHGKDFTVGSIGNVWKCLSRINPSLSIDIEATDFGEALILVDEKKSLRASTANLSLFTKTPNINPSRWHHVLYVNELDDASFVEKISTGIVSVDFCRGKVLENLDTLKNVDFAFISDEDVFMDLKEMSKIVKSGVILHYKTGGTYYASGEQKFSTKSKIVKNVNVLGCGDIFASCFIGYYMEKPNIESSMQKSHDYITGYLSRNRIAENEKEI